MPMRPSTLAYIRRNLAVTAEQLDTDLGLPPGTIADAEAGELDLSEPIIMAIRNRIAAREAMGTIPDRLHFGMLIRQARVAMGLSQQAVADKAQINQAAYSRIEGSVNPRFSTVQRVAAAIGIPVDWILKGNVPLTDDYLTGITRKSPE